jgi:hypothetical protein
MGMLQRHQVDTMEQLQGLGTSDLTDMGISIGLATSLLRHLENPGRQLPVQTVV